MSGAGDWKYYFPDDGEDVSDAQKFPQSADIEDVEDAARIACERDYNNHDGGERRDATFLIAIVCPTGEICEFEGQHEPSVEHTVYARSKKD